MKRKIAQLSGTSMFVSAASILFGGQAMAQQAKPAQQAGPGKGYTVETVVETDADGCVVTKQIIKPTKEQLYKNRWAKWKEDNNATDKQVQDAQKKESEAWRAVMNSGQRNSALANVDKLVEATAEVKEISRDCPEGVDCDTIPTPVVALKVPPLVVPDTVEISTICPTCPTITVDSVEIDVPKKEAWELIGGVGSTRPTGHNPDALHMLGNKTSDNYLFAEIKSPSFSTTGIGSWMRGMAGIRLYQKKPINDVLVVNPGQYEDSYHLMNMANANASKNEVYAGVEFGKDINITNDQRFKVRPNVFVQSGAKITQEKFSFPEGDGDQVTIAKPLPLDANIGGGLIATLNFGSKNAVRNGNGPQLYVAGGWENRGAFGKQAAFVRNETVPDGAEFGPRMSDSRSGVFKSGDFNIAVGIKLNVGGHAATTRKEAPTVRREEPAVSYDELIKQQQENRLDTLQNSDGSKIFVLPPNLKVTPRPAQ